ncbi:sigma-54 interaction domain-containing protein [Neobacillus sp. C211]|uniref:sigma-54 interaction domain-containing protein n=1 Tax=unclassified Neobacillus TaxID=2675272 RepID=UPI00397A78F4
MFELPSVKEIIENNFICLNQVDNENTLPKVYLHDSFAVLADSFKRYPVVAITDSNGQTLGCITNEQIINFLHDSYNQLKVFYETVIETSDASVTVIDADERVRTWTKGAEKIFSVNKDEIIGKPIIEFFEHQNLEILESLHKGKRIRGKHHQARSDLFVLINANPVYFNESIIGAVVSETNVTNQVVLNEKLFNMSTEVHRLEQEVAKYRPSDPFNAIKGKSVVMEKTVQMAKKVCTVRSTVLILGESGVGKEVFSKAIHEATEGPDAPFISINCGAIPESLFESELFGYERGAFSGADHRGKKGKIELAKGGTLFLDEIGEMPLEMQVKMLRVLQERKYYKVGGEKEIEADFRVIAATNRDLKELIKEGQFREDLYYRLNVVSIKIPPLRERREDIVELIYYFLKDFSPRYQRPIHNFPQEVMQEMLQYYWPGNVRELRNVIERLVVFTTDGVIRKEYLPFHSEMSYPDVSNTDLQENNMEMDTVILPLQEEMDQHEKKVFEKALALTHGNKLECSKKLGITRATLYNRLKRLGLG